MATTATLTFSIEYFDSAISTTVPIGKHYHTEASVGLDMAGSVMNIQIAAAATAILTPTSGTTGGSDYQFLITATYGVGATHDSAVTVGAQTRAFADIAAGVNAAAGVLSITNNSALTASYMISYHVRA